MVGEIKIQNRRVFMTGDCHGDFAKLSMFFASYPETSGALFVLLGDVGVNYWGDKRDKANRIMLSKLPYTFLMVHGNHERRPSGLARYESTLWEGNGAWVHPEYPNQVFLDDGEAQIDGVSILVMNGAYSVDKYYRLASGRHWFSDEQMPLEKQSEILRITDGKSYDIILSHTCPFFNRPIDSFLPVINQSTVDTGMEEFLQKVKDGLAGYGNWYCGHYHIDRKERDVHFLFNDIIEIENSCA